MEAARQAAKGKRGRKPKAHDKHAPEPSSMARTISPVVSDVNAVNWVLFGKIVEALRNEPPRSVRGIVEALGKLFPCPPAGAA